MIKDYRSFALVQHPEQPLWMFLDGHASSVGSGVDQAVQATATDDLPATPLRLLGGQRIGGESFRETVLRECAWQLGLDRARDLLVAHMARINLEFVSSEFPGVEERGGQPVHFGIAFYLTLLYSRQARQLANVENACAASANGQRLRWLTPAEVLDGCTVSGQKLDPFDHWLLLRSEAIPPSGML